MVPILNPEVPVILLALLLSAQVQAAAPLELTIKDPQVLAVMLECQGRDTLRSVVRNGKASFPAVPRSACEVHYIRRSGTIDGPGVWTCDLQGCTQERIHHRAVQDAPGRLNIVFTAEADSVTSLELTCPNGFRARAAVEENAATFDGVPGDRCTVHVRGGAPASYNGVTEGTWHCKFSGGTTLCIRP